MEQAGVTASDGGGRASDRVLTVPNALSALRLVGVPVFVWLLVVRADGWALVVLALSGVSDYLDGKIARRYHLESRLGALLDPLADRLYTLATILTFAWRGIIPVWLVVVLLGRDVFMAGLVLALRRVGLVGLPVHFVGKAATFNLLYAFPLLLVGEASGALGAVARPLAWAFTWWGTGLYLLAAALYAVQAAPLLRSRPATLRAG